MNWKATDKVASSSRTDSSPRYRNVNRPALCEVPSTQERVSASAAFSGLGDNGERFDWDDVIDRIETVARAGRPIRRALTSVHLTGEHEARRRP